MNLTMPNAGLSTTIDPNSPWNLVGYPDGATIFDSDGLDDLFDDNNGDLLHFIDEALAHETENFSTSPEQQIDPFLQDARVVSHASTFHSQQDLNEALVPHHQGQVATSGFQQLPLQIPEMQVGQSAQQPKTWQAFTDVHQGRLWMLKAQQSPTEASLQDMTIPRTIEQKRAVADRLRAAFEGAQPSANGGQFRLLDWTCLELVEEVCMFHVFGPLSRRYHSGLPKHGPADFDSYDDHISALMSVIGRQDCPKARSLRKRMLDITHRKRLIDNPVAELGTVKKNDAANSTRKLKNEERKRKADRTEAAELEVAKLKAQLDIQSSMETLLNGTDEDWDEGHGRNQSGPAIRRIVTPSRPSAKLSAIQTSTSMADHPRQVQMVPAVATGISSDHVNNNTSPTSFGGKDTRRESMSTDAHGPALAKKAKCMDNQVTPSSEFPTKITSATAALGMINMRQRQMEEPNEPNGQDDSQAMQQPAHISYSQHHQGHTQMPPSVTPENQPARLAARSRAAPTFKTTEVTSPSRLTTMPEVRTITSSASLPAAQMWVALSQGPLQDAGFMAHYTTIHSDLSLEQVAEAGRLGLGTSEYAYRVTLKMYGRSGGLDELL